MVTQDAKEYPKTIPSEIQGGRPLHFLRVLSRCTLLEYPPIVLLILQVLPLQVLLASPSFTVARPPTCFDEARPTDG